MALSYRQTPATSQSGATVTSFAVTKQTGTAAGDWIFIYLFGTNSTTVACPGFTVLNDQNSYGCLLYRLADGTEGTTFTITGIGTVRVGTIIATVAGGASTLDAIGNPNNSSASTSLGVVGLTLAKSADWVLWFGANENGFSAASFTITPPSGFTSRAAITAQTNNPAMVLADNTTLPVGATGTKTGTCTSSSYWSGVMVAVALAPQTISGTATLGGAGGLGSKPAVIAPKGTSLGAKGSVAANATTAVPGMVLSGAGSITGTPVTAPAGAFAFPGQPPNALGFKAELNLGGTWTDITQYVLLRDQVHISGMGRADEQSTISSAQLSMTLRNDGRFTPKNAGGAYYPNIVRNCQVRISVNATGKTGIKYSGYRFYGEISSWPPGYDISQRDTAVQVTASGLWRRVSQSTIPIGSCFTRYVLLLGGAQSPAGYWPMEDEGTNTSVATPFVLADGTGTNMAAQGGVPSYAADGTSFAGSNALPQLNGSRLAANVTMSGATSFCVRFALSVPAANDSSGSTFPSGNQLMKILTSGTVATIYINLGPDSSMGVIGQNSGGTTLFSATLKTKVNGTPYLVSYEQTGGAYALKLIKPGGTGVFDQVTNAGFAWTIGNITQVQVSPQGRLNDTTVGQMQVYSTTNVDIVAAANNLGGRVGEQAADRFARLCSESNIAYQLIGSGGATLGPQLSETMANILQSIEDSDGGLLYEPRDALALGYRTLQSIMDQVPAASFSHSSGVLGAPLEPTYDDQLIRNQWTLNNYDGYSVTAQLNTGAMSILSPPNGVGAGYAGQRTVNLSTHPLVNTLAQQLLDEGCCDEVRYPNVVINFQRAAAAPYFSIIPNMRVGDHFQITSLPSFLGGGTTKQLAWGYDEILGGEVPAWQFSFNTIPELPFESAFSAGTATVSQGVPGGVSSGSGLNSVSGAQIGPGTVGVGELANTVTARRVGGTTTLISATTPYDWTFNPAGTPGDNTYFVTTQDQAQLIAQGDTFFTTVNYGSTFFTVTSTDPPSNGLVNVHFTPDASAPMAGGLINGGKNGDLWINTSQGNSVYQWFNGAWTQYQFGPGAMSFNVQGTQVTFSVTAPASPKTGDLWYNAASGYVLSQWDGTTWQSYQYGSQAISAQSIGAQHIITGTIVAGIVNGTTIEGVYFIAGAGGGVNWQSATPNVPGFFMYLDTGAGNPQLVFSIAAGPGTDQWGNTWQGGATFVGLATLLNVLSVEDTSGNILGGFDYQGNVTGNVINATTDLQMQGTSILTLINNPGVGIVNRGWAAATASAPWPSTAIGTSSTAVLELDCTVPAGRRYMFQVLPSTVLFSTAPAVGQQLIFRLYYTTDGTVPSTSSTQADGRSPNIIPIPMTNLVNYPTPYADFILPLNAGSDVTYRFLLTANISSSGSFKFTNNIEARFVDLGVDQGQYGNSGVALGSGTSGGGGGLQTYTKYYYPTQTYSYYGLTAANGRTPNTQRNVGSNMWQSCTYTPDRAFYEGDQYSFAIFNVSQIATDVGAGTINYAKLRLTNNNSYYSNGTNAIVGYTIYSGSFGNPFVPGSGTHQNMEMWTVGGTVDHTLGSWWVTSAFGGSWTGFVFGTAYSYDGYTDQHNYGSFVGNDGTTSNKPRLTVNYTKLCSLEYHGSRLRSHSRSCDAEQHAGPGCGQHPRHLSRSAATMVGHHVAGRGRGRTGRCAQGYERVG